MASNGIETTSRKAVIGNETSFWLYDSRTGFDLTHPPTATSPSIKPRVTIETTTTPITVDPAKTALVIVDMQNFFLSPAFGRQKGAGHAACNKLIEHAIPAARAAGVRVVWLNWGLTEREVQEMPPAIKRAFGFEALEDGNDEGQGVDKDGQTRPMDQGGKLKIYKGIGTWCGMLHDPETGEDIDAGMLLMRDQWNTALYRPLDKLWQEGKKLASPHRTDVWIHKNRMSGMWGVKTECEAYLEQEGIKTLLFTGVNTDQCVSGTLTDSFSKGYDCVLLSDGAGTTSPAFAQKGIEFNAAKTWGFETSCEAFAKGVEAMKKSER